MQPAQRCACPLAFLQGCFHTTSPSAFPTSLQLALVAAAEAQGRSRPSPTTTRWRWPRRRRLRKACTQRHHCRGAPRSQTDHCSSTTGILPSEQVVEITQQRVKVLTSTSRSLLGHLALRRRCEQVLRRSSLCRADTQCSARLHHRAVHARGQCVAGYKLTAR